VTRKTTDGTRHFILHVVPIRLDAENASGYAIYTDVTERREREATLREQNERLDEFASIVSHDLRNPLSVAEGYVTLASDTGDPTHLDKAETALERMDELVGDLLSLARQGRSVGETEPVSIATLAREAWESVDAVEADLVVESDVSLDADPARTRELFENVFRNSVEHGRPKAGETGAGGDEGPSEDRDGDALDDLTIRVGEASFRSGDGDVTGFFVEDDGRGLPEESHRVFESGFTTDEGGTGLGLAISERIAEAHGWEVRALTGESGGARFEFRTS
jgi:signal transduction histidine kinase